MRKPLLMKLWSVRGPTPGESALLAEVFGRALDATRLRLWCFPPADWFQRAFCAGGWLWPGKSFLVYPPKGALTDFTAPDAPLSVTAVFVHECTHAAQSQSGVNLALGKLRAGDTVETYRYTLSPETCWDRLNIEQQAMLMEHAFLRSRGKTTPYPLKAYLAVLPYPR